jgi:hypothetical protein
MCRANYTERRSGCIGAVRRGAEIAIDVRPPGPLGNSHCRGQLVRVVILPRPRAGTRWPGIGLHEGGIGIAQSVWRNCAIYWRLERGGGNPAVVERAHRGRRTGRRDGRPGALGAPARTRWLRLIRPRGCLAGRGSRLGWAVPGPGVRRLAGSANTWPVTAKDNGGGNTGIGPPWLCSRGENPPPDLAR